MVIVATVCVVTCAGYGRIRPGQGIGAVGALAARGSHAAEEEQSPVNAPKPQKGQATLGKPQGHGPGPSDSGYRHARQ